MGAVLSHCCPARETSARQEGERPDSFHSPQFTEARSDVANKDQSPKSAMDPRCRLALRKSTKELIQDLDVKCTVDHLYSKLLLTSEDKQRIEGMSTDRDKRRTLLDLLPGKSQRAYDEFLESLSSDQPWLKTALDTNHKSITEDELANTGLQQYPDVHTAELRKSLKQNLQDRLDEWKTALEEGVSDRKELLPYINQPCTVKRKDFEQESVLNTINLVENSKPGDRITIYAEAGMGKTTLMKQLARSWLEGSNAKLADKFSYVFLIPLRLVGKAPLLNIICDELELIPASNLKSLKEALDRNERETLFLLDSFEELRGDVLKAKKKTEIEDLITGRMFPKSTVVVTSRPGSKLRRAEDQPTAELQDLPENEVKGIITQHFGENEDAVQKVQRSFPAMAYLQKPINLALFILIITQNKHLTLSYTQAELFSLVLQYIMLAFAKKKKLEEFIPQSGSYLANKDIPGDIRRLFRDIAKKCYEERKKNNVVLHVDDADDLKEYLNFGLFTAGSEANTVILPHRLFIEYFSAAHLAENPNEWAALFEEIKEKSESKSPRSLPDVVRSLGLENVLRFVIALSPQPQLDQMCRQIGSLFLLEREKIGYSDNYRLANFDEYYTELIDDCNGESGKRVLATALLNAPVREVAYRAKEDRSHTLLSFLDYKQCIMLLKKVQNLDLRVDDIKSTLSCTGNSGRIGIGDKFVAALVQRHDGIIEADELTIRDQIGCQLDLPASVFTRMPGVRQLRLAYCTLCKRLPDYMRDVDISGNLQDSSLGSTNNALQRVELERVKGLDHCDVITSCHCQLEMKFCDDVRLSALKKCFPKVAALDLDHDTVVVHETEGELTSWLSSVRTVRRLNLAPQHEGESLSLCHLLNILSEREGLEKMWLIGYTLLLDVGDISGTAKQNNTLRELCLVACMGDVDLGQLLEVCRRECPQLKEVDVSSSNLVLDLDDEKVASVKLKHLPGLQRFRLYETAVHTSAGQRLSKSEVKQRLCTLTEINVWDYPSSKSKPLDAAAGRRLYRGLQLRKEGEKLELRQRKRQEARDLRDREMERQLEEMELRQRKRQEARLASLTQNP